jgi:tetratricopeptide (TPR) repeat protein
MPRRQIAIYVVALAAMLVYYAWIVRRYLHKRRLRQQLVEQGRLPAQRARRRGARRWLLTLALVAATFPLFWLSERFVKPVAGTVASMAAFCGAVFVLAFAVVILRSRGTSDPVVYNALHLAKQGRVEEALRALREAIAVSPEPSPRRAGALGLVLAGADRWTEAVEAYRDARRIDPSEPVFIVNLAMALTRTDRAAEALEIVEEARKAAPAEAGFAAAEAMALAGLGRIEEAAEQHRQAKELFEVGPAEQRLDMWTLGDVLLQAGKAVEEAGAPRAFPVVPPATAPQSGGASSATEVKK